MSDNEHRPGVAEPASLEEILRALNEAGKFQATVLAAIDGLLIAALPSDYDTDAAAAMVALLQRVSNDAQSQLGMAGVDEVTIRDRDRIRLVCRYLVVGGERLILAMLVPPGHRYRRVTNRAIRQIRQLLS